MFRAAITAMGRLEFTQTSSLPWTSFNLGQFPFLQRERGVCWKVLVLQAGTKPRSTRPTQPSQPLHVPPDPTASIWPRLC